MAIIVLKAVLEALKHVFYHVLGSMFEKMIEAVLQKRRKKRKRAHTKRLAVSSRDAPHVSDPVLGTCIILIRIDDSYADR